jgi:hypothetical protein
MVDAFAAAHRNAGAIASGSSLLRFMNKLLLRLVSDV